jgi:hypothetical protein
MDDMKKKMFLLHKWDILKVKVICLIKSNIEERIPRGVYRKV